MISLNNLYHDQIMYLVKCLNELNELADFIIIDTGAGISDQVLEFVMASPEVLLVTTPEPSSLTDSYSLLKALYRNPNFQTGGTTIHVIPNKVTSREEGMAVYEKLESVVEQFLNGHLNYLGMIPQDAALERSVRQQKTVSLNEPNAHSTKAFALIAESLLSGNGEQTQLKWGITQLFTNFLSRKR